MYCTLYVSTWEYRREVSLRRICASYFWGVEHRVGRVLSFFSSRRNCDPPTPSPNTLGAKRRPMNYRGCRWTPTGVMRSCRECMRFIAEWFQRLPDNAKVATTVTVLSSIPASSVTVESEGQQMKQCWIKYYKNQTNPPLEYFFQRR